MKVLHSLRSNKNKANTANKTSGHLIRLINDFQNIEECLYIKIIHPDPKKLDIFNFIISPKEGHWSGGNFKFSIEVPKTYPNDPPKALCMTLPIWHPNINFDGNVCLNILRQDWTPVMDINTVSMGLLHLFLSPNPNDPLPNRCIPDKYEAHTMMIKKPAKFAEMVKTVLKGGYIEKLDRAFPNVTN